jgi:hypothetical protein
MAETKVITDKAPYESKILSITQGKSWEGTDKVTRTEYKVEFANGHLPIFNIKETPQNKNREFPFKTGDTVAYKLTEKELYNKIRQYGQLDMTKTIQLQNQTAPASEQKEVPMAKEDSIALAVAAKLAETTYNSEGWQKTLTLKAKKADENATLAETTAKLQAAAQTKMLSSIGQLTMAYFKLLTKKPN